MGIARHGASVARGAGLDSLGGITRRVSGAAGRAPSELHPLAYPRGLDRVAVDLSSRVANMACKRVVRFSFHFVVREDRLTYAIKHTPSPEQGSVFSERDHSDANC